MGMVYIFLINATTALTACPIPFLPYTDHMTTYTTCAFQFFHIFVYLQLSTWIILGYLLPFDNKGVKDLKWPIHQIFLCSDISTKLSIDTFR